MTGRPGRSRPGIIGRNRLRAQRRQLLWQVADLLGFLARSRQWWAVMDPDVYGTWARDQWTS